jgi:catechol 2,3-dioxygenase-like lactoylglutathione lyase family enzyme
MRNWLIGIAALAVVAVSVAAMRLSSPGVEYRSSLVVQMGETNLDRAIAFYRDTLGFTVTERRDDLKFAHIASNVSGVEFGLSEAPAPLGSGSTVLNIGVAHVGDARRALEAKGVAFRGQTVVIPGKVALAAFADPDGNVLRLAGPPATATSTR